MRMRIRGTGIDYSGINRITVGSDRSTAEERERTAGAASTVFR